MRVMLVTPITIVSKESKNAPRPEVGDIDTVTDEKQAPGIGLFYSLERFGPDYYYWSELFAILPDTPAEVIEKGGKQAIETSAMNAMWDAIEEGKGREEAEKIFFSFFNKSHERK